MQLRRLNLKKSLKIAVLFTFTAAIFLLPIFAVLAAPDTGLEYAAQTGLSSQDIRITIAKIIRIFFGFLGILAVCLIMWAGWEWMSSEGNPERINEAKKIMKNAAIGLLIILCAFGIVSFILSKLTNGDYGNDSGGGGIGMRNLASDANKVIENHYPASNQKNVARNTKIAITFREAILPASIITNDKLNPDTIQIYKTVEGENGTKITDVRAMSTPDNKTFVFKPNEYLGSPSENVWYTVAITKNLKKANGQSAFASIGSNIGYYWSFEIGTYLDFTPPKVESVIPLPADTEPRNVVIQINFNEAVDPITAMGATKAGFDKIVINNKSAGGAVDGNFYISNMYKTVEFLTEVACGTNSCGDTVYCLPASSTLQALIKAADLLVIDASSTMPSAIFPYTGVVDMADNSFDGNGDGKAQGPQSQSKRPPYDANAPSKDTQGDDYVWTFNINSTIDLSAPIIESIKPGIKEAGVSLDATPETKFSKFLMSKSLIKDSIAFYSNPKNSEVYYWLDKYNSTSSKKTFVNINHDQFYEKSDYIPEFNSGIKDIYQNCYTPAGGPQCTPDKSNNRPYCCDGQQKAKNCQP